ncbi:MAG: hypothetical protein KDE27_09060 [Planctomycetes bacterium]|nr:hypothetical protein [Planctomycetota bacterium]
MHPDFDSHRLADEQVDDLLDDLEIRCAADVTAARDMATVRRRVRVEVRPGNASERVGPPNSGDTTELRSQVVTAVTPLPVMVGDVCHVTFDRDQLDLAPELAICDRCTMLGDSQFEVRLKFVREIALPSHLAK